MSPKVGLVEAGEPADDLVQLGGGAPLALDLRHVERVHRRDRGSEDAMHASTVVARFCSRAPWSGLPAEDGSNEVDDVRVAVEAEYRTRQARQPLLVYGDAPPGEVGVVVTRGPREEMARARRPFTVELGHHRPASGRWCPRSTRQRAAALDVRTSTALREQR